MQQNQVLTPKLRQINSFCFGFSFVLLLNFYCQQCLASFKVTHGHVYMLKSIPKQKQNKNYNQSIVKACYQKFLYLIISFTYNFPPFCFCFWIWIFSKSCENDNLCIIVEYVEWWEYIWLYIIVKMVSLEAIKL